MSSDKRRFSRVPFAATTLMVSGGRSVAAELLNISLNGVLLRFATMPELDPETPYEIRFRLADGQTELVFKALPVHRQAPSVGFRFIEMDLDTVAHLRRLMELNLGDGDAVTQEMMQLY